MARDPSKNCHVVSYLMLRTTSLCVVYVNGFFLVVLSSHLCYFHLIASTTGRVRRDTIVVLVLPTSRPEAARRRFPDAGRTVSEDPGHGVGPTEETARHRETFGERGSSGEQLSVSRTGAELPRGVGGGAKAKRDFLHPRRGLPGGGNEARAHRSHRPVHAGGGNRAQERPDIHEGGRGDVGAAGGWKKAGR